MERLRVYRVPLMSGVGALLLIVVVYFTWIAHEGSKLSALHAQETTLQGQQASLQAEIATLKREKQNLGPTCAALTKDIAAVPATPQVDSFFQQVTALAVSSGDPNTPSIGVAQASGAQSAATAVAVNLTLSGNYGQMSSFLQGLYTFPRLFTITSISISGGSVANGGAAPAPGTPNYSLTLSGNIYYSAAQQNACAPVK